jgi:hypothetical protein
MVSLDKKSVGRGQCPATHFKEFGVRKMKKHSSKMVITGLLLVVLSLFMMFQPLFTWALEQENLRGCAFEVDPTEYLFQLGNMNPGDTYQGTVTVTKTGPSRGDIYFSWLYVSGNPPYPGENNLFEQLWLVIKQGDLVLYEGPMVGGSTPDEPLAIEDFEYLISMNQGDVVLLDFFVTLPGSITGNLYQGAELETELIFVSVCSGSPKPNINIEKATNGADADVPRGPSILVGGAVTWTYVVTNTGNVPLRNIVVTDNRTGVNPVYISGDTNGDEILQVEEIWTYQATGVAVAGQYANIGTVVGTPPSGSNVTDSDPSHYFGFTPDETVINIEKYTNGVDADLPTGPQIPVGGAVTWTYVVTNPNTIPLFDIVVTDNRAGVMPVYISGDLNEDSILQPGEVWTYSANSIAVAGQYANIGTASGVTARGKVVTDTDPSHYFGVTQHETEISIEKYTNGVDADLPTGPQIPVGGAVTWTYVVTNPNTIPLYNVVVTDNRMGVNPVYISGDVNEDNVLQPGEVWTYRASSTAVAGQYANIGTARGATANGKIVSDSDPSHYFGFTPDETVINIEKFTNGFDADLPTGPQITVGGNVTWTYVVTNPNTIPLFNIVVTDNRAGVVPAYVSGDINGDNVLQPGEVWTYRATGIAVAGQYSNIGSVTGVSAGGKVVTDTDPSHYFGLTTPPTEEEVGPEEPETEPEEEEVIIPPEGPKVDPPLPRTDGMSMSIFLIGFVFIAAGVLLKKGSEDKKGRSMQI